MCVCVCMCAGERQPANLRAAAQAQHARHTAAAAAPHDTPTVPEEASPPVQHAAPPQDATPSGTPGVEALFGPNTSSLDLSSIPADGYAMFPVPEESSAMYREIEGSPQAGMTRDSLDTSGSRLGSSQQGLGGARWPHAGLRVQPPGTANTSSPSTSSPRRGLTSAQDLVRHQQAMQVRMTHTHTHAHTCRRGIHTRTHAGSANSWCAKGGVVRVRRDVMCVVVCVCVCRLLWLCTKSMCASASGWSDPGNVRAPHRPCPPLPPPHETLYTHIMTHACAYSMHVRLQVTTVGSLAHAYHAVQSTGVLDTA